MPIPSNNGRPKRPLRVQNAGRTVQYSTARVCDMIPYYYTTRQHQSVQYSIFCLWHVKASSLILYYTEVCSLVYSTLQRVASHRLMARPGRATRLREELFTTATLSTVPLCEITCHLKSYSVKTEPSEDISCYYHCYYHIVVIQPGSRFSHATAQMAPFAPSIIQTLPRVM